MPFNLGFGEVLVILIVALLVFGGRLPEVGRSLGRGIVEFKAGLKGAAAELMPDDDDQDPGYRKREPAKPINPEPDPDVAPEKSPE